MRLLIIFILILLGATHNLNYIIDRVIQQKDKIKTLDLIATRTSDRLKFKEVIRFIYKKNKNELPKIYISYIQPSKLEYYYNGKELWLYSPKRKLAAKATNITDINAYIKDIIGEGFYGEKLLSQYNFELIKEDDTYLLSGRNIQRQEILLVELNKKKFYPLMMEVLDKDKNLMMRIEFKEYKLFKDSIYFPLAIEMSYFDTSSKKAQKDSIKFYIKYEKVKINLPISDEIFNFIPPKGVKVENFKIFF